MAPRPAAPEPDLHDLFAAWERREAVGWDAKQFAATARRALALGQPTFAFDVASTGRGRYSGNVELAFVSALALAESGSIGAASREIATLLEIVNPRDPRYVEALSLAGRLAKEIWRRSTDPAERAQAAANALAHYRRAWRESDNYFPGINTASLLFLAGERDECRRIAADVVAQLDAGDSQAGIESHWISATLGEAALLLGEDARALECYAAAAEQTIGKPAARASMRRQLRLLATFSPIANEALALLAAPPIVVFTGHMVDAPGRAVPRFPRTLEMAVIAGIAGALDALRPAAAYVSAACGADLLFAEETIRRGIELNVLLPFAEEEFVATSVTPGGEDWVARFRSVLAAATRVLRNVEESYLGDEVLFHYNNQCMQGLALLRARRLESDAIMLAVVDASTPGRQGGALGALEAWRQLGGEARIVDLGALRTRTERAATSRPPAMPVAASHDPAIPPRRVCAMLFADVVGYSALVEKYVPLFFMHFLGKVGEVIEQSDEPPRFANTWGDGLYMVFDAVPAAAAFALRLRDFVADTDWQALGLPRNLSIRIGMHAGPVFPGYDRVIRRDSIFGSHVTRAARIEPVTVPGSVYVSEQFAALLAANRQTAFECDYIGDLALAKQYGSIPSYRLRRATEID